MLVCKGKIWREIITSINKINVKQSKSWWLYFIFHLMILCLKIDNLLPGKTGCVCLFIWKLRSFSTQNISILAMLPVFFELTDSKCTLQP